MVISVIYPDLMYFLLWADKYWFERSEQALIAVVYTAYNF